MHDEYEIAVDFMDMTDERHLWARAADARPGIALSIGRHVVVGDEDADSKVARIVAGRTVDGLVPVPTGTSNWRYSPAASSPIPTCSRQRERHGSAAPAPAGRPWIGLERWGAIARRYISETSMAELATPRED